MLQNGILMLCLNMINYMNDFEDNNLIPSRLASKQHQEYFCAASFLMSQSKRQHRENQMIQIKFVLELVNT